MGPTHHPSTALVCPLIGALLFGCFGCFGCSTPAAAPAPRPDHLWWEEDLVMHVAPEDNTYGSDPFYVTWAGVDGAAGYANRSACTTFLMLSLEQARGWTSEDIQAWLGSPGPTAARLHDAIVAEDGFSRIEAIGEIAPGDVIAIRYPEDEAATGHAATAADVPRARVATAPLVAGTSQFEVTVVDSSKSGHGPTDTRRQPDGSWHRGAGRGVLRIYGDDHDRIVGYAWSTFARSVFHPSSTRHLAVGRLR